MPIDCDIWHKQVEEYISWWEGTDSELSKMEVLKRYIPLLDHPRVCAACSEELEELQQSWADLQRSRRFGTWAARQMGLLEESLRQQREES